MSRYAVVFGGLKPTLIWTIDAGQVVLDFGVVMAKT